MIYLMLLYSLFLFDLNLTSCNCGEWTCHTT